LNRPKQKQLEEVFNPTGGASQVPALKEKELQALIEALVI